MPHIIYKLISTTVNLYDSDSSDNGQLLRETTTKNINDYLNVIQNLTVSLNDKNFNDSSTNSSNYVPYDKRPETYIIPIIFSIIFLLGLIGNGLLVYAYFNQKSLRTIPNTYIISLSFGDLLAILIVLPFVSTIYTVESWPYGVWVCKSSELIRDVSTGVSVYTLTILSYDRYVAIVCPFKRYASKRKKTTLVNTLCIWSFSILISIPGFLSSHLKKFKVSNNKEISVCYPFPEEYGDIYPKLVVMSKFLILYLLPLLFIFWYYCFIAIHLYRSFRNFNKSNSNNTYNKHIQKKRRKVAKIVLIFIVIFAVCFFPSHTFLLWFYLWPNAQNLYNDFWHYLRIIGFVLSFTNSCLNPIALYFISGEFRKYFKMYLCSCTCDKSLNNQPNSTNSVYTNQQSTTQDDQTRTTIAYLTNQSTNYLNTPNNRLFHNQLSINSSNNLSFSATKFKCCSNWGSYDDDSSEHGIDNNIMLKATGVVNNNYNLNNNHLQTSNQINNQTSNQINNQINNQTSNQINNQTSNQINNQTSNQINNHNKTNLKQQKSTDSFKT